MKAIEQYFYGVLFIMLHKVVSTFKSLGETLMCDHSNESYYFHVILFIMLFKAVLTFKSLGETLMCDHSNERY